MKKVRHGKIPKWYNEEAESEHAFNESSPFTITINTSIEKLLKKYKVKTVLDLTCGTGSQVFWLSKRGYEVVGSDVNEGMLKIAIKKTKAEKLNIKFLHGDMRTVKVGKFDAALTISNSIGHLTKLGFEKTLKNIYRNLNEEGIYIFDILGPAWKNPHFCRVIVKQFPLFCSLPSQL